MRHTVHDRGRVRDACRHHEGSSSLRQVWCFMLPDVRMPSIPVFEEIHFAVRLAQNAITNSTPNSIDVRHHFLSELVERKYISILHVLSPFEHADFVAKPISRESIEFHRGLAMKVW